MLFRSVVCYLRLYVGWGTFRPVSAADYKNHQMLPEEFDLPVDTARLINDVRSRGHKIWAVGTTTVRTLESQSDERGHVSPGTGETSLYIYPGYRFKAIDHLVTNFHMPGHTPLLLTSAFASPDLLRQAYREAIAQRYRFFSYGDAMVIL